ncbi:MAG: hypothetical protein PHE67_10080 [Campylobacterales bacterium]|nr:hypothetical protein [Campylobacterales bacterium]
MAGGGDNGEMNPFISYVDLFSSVILVLLLFVLIMFVNVGYYMQFNAKNPETTDAETQEMSAKKSATSEKPQESKQIVLVDKPIIEVKEQKKEQQQKDTNKTVVEGKGGTSEGTAILKRDSKPPAPAELKVDDLIIVFRNNDYFVSNDMIRQTASALENILTTRPNATFVITVSDSKKIISATQAKQVSLGRVLGLKNKLSDMDKLKNKVKINFQQSESLGYDYGHIKIEVK